MLILNTRVQGITPEKVWVEMQVIRRVKFTDPPVTVVNGMTPINYFSKRGKEECRDGIDFYRRGLYPAAKKRFEASIAYLKQARVLNPKDTTCLKVYCISLKKYAEVAYLIAKRGEGPEVQCNDGIAKIDKLLDILNSEISPFSGPQLKAYHAEALYRKGCLLFERGRYFSVCTKYRKEYLEVLTQSLRFLEEAFNLDNQEEYLKKRESVYDYYGDCFFNSGNYSKAKEVFKQAHLCGSLPVKEKGVLGSRVYFSWKVNRCRVKVKDPDRDCRGSCKKLGRMYFRKRKWDKAIACFSAGGFSEWIRDCKEERDAAEDRYSFYMEQKLGLIRPSGFRFPGATRWCYRPGEAARLDYYCQGGWTSIPCKTTYSTRGKRF